jgi:hypothetical protein
VKHTFTPFAAGVTDAVAGVVAVAGGAGAGAGVGDDAGGALVIARVARPLAAVCVFVDTAARVSDAFDVRARVYLSISPRRKDGTRLDFSAWGRQPLFSSALHRNKRATESLRR